MGNDTLHKKSFNLEKFLDPTYDIISHCHGDITKSKHLLFAFCSLAPQMKKLGHYLSKPV